MIPAVIPTIGIISPLSVVVWWWCAQQNAAVASTRTYRTSFIVLGPRFDSLLMAKLDRRKSDRS